MGNGFGSYLTAIGAFLPDVRRKLTIRQVAIQCGGSYGWGYATCSAMIRHGLLRSQRVGSAILCSLAPQNDVTILLLALASAERARAVLAAKPALADQTRHVLAALADPLLCVLHTPEGFAVVEAGRQSITTVNGERLLSIPPEELGTALLQATVLQNFELAWRLALKAPRENQ
jgi:hypothetical protein